MSSKQLWPAGPRNAKVAWKKRATPKAKAAPVNPGDGEHAAPKARSKAHKKIEKKTVHPLVTIDFMWHLGE